MMKVTLTNEILSYITEIEHNRYKVSSVKLSKPVMNRLRKNSKKKSSYASNKIEGNPLSEKQVDEVIERDERKHYLKPEQEVRNYFLALNYLEEKVSKKEKFSQKLYSDSAYLVNAFKQNWIDGWQRNGWKTAAKKPVENQDLWKWLLTVMQPHQVTIIKVKGHADNPWNNRCDELATGQIRSHRNG